MQQHPTKPEAEPSRVRRAVAMLALVAMAWGLGLVMVVPPAWTQAAKGAPTTPTAEPERTGKRPIMRFLTTSDFPDRKSTRLNSSHG